MEKEVAFIWDGALPILRILLVGTVTFISIIIMLRVSGKRTLAQMNAFDFIITVTIGSAFGRILTATEVSITESITTFLLLFTLQYILAFIEIKSAKLSRMVTAPPTLLYYKGAFIEKNMIKERIRKDDIMSAVRKRMFTGLEEVEAVILESSGSFSVLKKNSISSSSTYEKILKEEAQRNKQ
ncbi:DUF421 domain-containing protein [Cytophagaceae bacterium ABcell3]|nr:DUF421 domain-containing protein [Cytophagaceae bacterium ABcell3]